MEIDIQVSLQIRLLEYNKNKIQQIREQKYIQGNRI
jgi:hypothetical protein